MPKDKYTLPIVDSLKDIGFQFEYSKKSDAVPYIQNFVKENFKVLHSVFYFRAAEYDEEGNIIALVNNPDDTENESPDEPEKDLVAKIERIKSGRINPRDYLFLVHPVHANNAEVLINSCTKKLRGLYGAKGNLIYRGDRWGLNLAESISECFYHKILDNLIFRIRDEGKIPPHGISENYFKIKDLLVEDSGTSEQKDGPLARLTGNFKNRKELAYYQGLLFSENLTLEKSAKLTVWKSRMPGPIESTTMEKERTIRYYLGLQAAMVKKARDNARKNKGINKSNRDKVIQVFKSNPKLSKMNIAEITGVNRKTVAKYINEISSE
jgi:hypothetical protein